MLDSIAIATDGYVSRTVKKALVIAVAGYLNFGGTPPEPPSGGSSSGQHEYITQDLTKEQREREERIKLDDDLFFNIIKIWAEKCQT